jgi:hypothetical protein
MIPIIKNIVTCFLILPAIAQSFAQEKIVDITRDRQSADRINILNLLRSKVKPQIKQDVTFVVRSLQLKNNYAFLKGNVKYANGEEIDFRKTIFKEDFENGMFDGNSIYALCKKVNGKWKYLVHAIGPTDVVYTCWASTYKAPKELFDYNENCGN